MRKALAIILCCIMFAPAIAVNAANFTQLSVNTDHLQVVKALGIMDGFANYDADTSYMTRGEFASVLCKLTNMNEYITSYKLHYNDVNEGHVYYNPIAAVSAQKIMIGDTDGNFMPDKEITYSQAVKCLIYILGYEVQAEKKGGYPVGYAISADKLGILENLDYSDNQLVTRAEIAQMIYNCLDVEMYELSQVSEDSVYSELNGGTILNRYLNVRKFEAVVNSADGRSILSRKSDTDEGKVKIGSTVLKYTDSFVPSLLGYRVEAYATDNGGNETLLYAFPTDDNKELMIKISDLDTDKSDFSLKNFFYVTQNGKTSGVQLSDEHRFMYNGVYDLDFDLDDLSFSTGYINLIDHNDDEIYDVCFVWNYENYVAESVSGDIVRCHYNKTLRKDTENKVTYRVMGSDGVWGDWNQLLKVNNWDVLSVSKSKDGSLVTIIPTRSGIGGTVEAVTEDDKKYAQINGFEYAISEQYLNLSRNTGYIPIKPGMRSEFYFDVIGEIAAVYRVENTESRYAWALNAAPKGSFTKTYEIKLFDEDGKIQIYTMADKVKFSSADIEEKSYKVSDVLTQLQDGVGNFVPQLVSYTIDENGILTEIKKSADATDIGYNLDAFSKDFDTTISSEKYNYQDSTSSFVHESQYNQVFHLNGTTKIFYLPCDDGEVIEDDMQIVDSTIFENNDDYQNLQVYDCDDTYNVSVLVYMPDASANSDVEVLDAYFIAVNDVYMGKDKYGDFKPMIKGMFRGVEEEFEYISVDGSTPEAGSIIQCQKNLKGELKIHRDYVIYSPSQGAILTERVAIKGSGRFPTIWTQTGRLWRKNGSAVSIYVGTERPWASYMNNSIVYEYLTDEKIFNTSNDSILIPSSGNPQSVPDGSLMVINYRYHYIREIFVIG